MEEVWKDIPNYEGLYQVSNLGRVRIFKNGKYSIRKNGTSRGYLNITLSLNRTRKTFLVHKLVAICFLNHVPDGTQKLVVDHINDNARDNRLENLQVITSRENVCKKQGNYTSKYKGVCWHKATRKWRAKLSVKYKSYWLGVFNTEEEASEVYQNKLKEILCEN
jgi:hypothetical protein